MQLGVQWKAAPKFEAEISHANFCDKKVVLVKPLTFANACSRSLMSYFALLELKSPESLLVLYDDITLEFSRVKLSQNGSSGGHNGIADLQEHLGDNFARFRIGTGPKP